MVRADVEREPIGAGRHRPLGQRRDAPFAVSLAASHRSPFAGLPHLEDDGHPDGRFAARGVEHVCRDHVVVS